MLPMLVVPRRREEAVGLAGAFVDRESDDLTIVIDGRGGRQVPVSSVHETIQIVHHTVLPHERACVEVGVQRQTDHGVPVVDADSSAPNIAGKGAKIRDASFLLQKKA